MLQAMHVAFGIVVGGFILLFVVGSVLGMVLWGRLMWG